jgi:hypothetical protein
LAAKRPSICATIPYLIVELFFIVACNDVCIAATLLLSNAMLFLLSEICYFSTVEV